MRSRGRLAFRPGLGTALGVDCLEPRQLLSAVGHVNDGAGSPGPLAGRGLGRARRGARGHGSQGGAGASSAAVRRSPGDRVPATMDGGSGVARPSRWCGGERASPARQPTSWTLPGRRSGEPARWRSPP